MKKLLVLLLAMFIADFSVSANEFILNPGERKTVSVVAPAAGKQLRMSVTARLESAKPGAGMLDAIVMVLDNKRILAEHLSPGESDKIVFRGKARNLFTPGKRMLILYSPSFQTTAQEAKVAGNNIFTRKFDLGSLMTPGKKSNIVFIHPWSPQQAARLKNALKLVMIVKFEEVPATAAPAAATKPAAAVKNVPAEKLIAKNYPGEIKIAPEEVRVIPFEHKPGFRSIVRITARQDTHHDLGGYAFVMELKVNGKTVTSRLDRSKLILQKRQEFFKRHNGKTVYYESAGAWLTIWSNGYTADPRGRYGLDAPEPYTYTLDVTPLAKAGKNELTIRNRWLKPMGQKYPREKTLCVIPEIQSVKLNAAAEETVKLPVFKKQAAFTVDQDGTLYLLNGDPGKIAFTAAYSQPGGGFNYLGKNKSAAQDWKPVVKYDSDKSVEITAQNQYYILKRNIKQVGNRLVFTDHLINKTSKNIAVRFRQTMQFPDFDLPVCRMGGNPGHSLDNYPSPGNPTIFWQGKNSSAGMAVEDDVARNQVLFFYDKKQRESGFYNDCFMLRGKAQYTVRWSLYLNDSDDYYDFINQIRKDWQVNHTIYGPVYFVGVNEIFSFSQAELAKHIKEKNARYVAFWEMREKLAEAGNKNVMAYGSALFMPQLEKARKRHIAAAAQWRKLFPQIRLAQYYHSFFNGYEKPDDQTYRDSWITNADGSRLASIYSAQVNYLFQTVCPYPGNKMWDIHCRSIDFLMNDIKVNWFYWDESNGPGVTSKDFVGASPMAFNMFDGNSALVDLKTNTIIKECGSLPLLIQPAMQLAFDRLKNKEVDFVLFNGAPSTSIRNQPGIYAMAETQDNIFWAYSLHLSTPLAYGFGTPPFSTIVERLDYGCLYIRTHITYPSTAVSKFYPITIEEIHSGWVQGKERVVTNRSGKFGWTGAYKARLWQYDKNGKCLNENPAIQSCKDKIVVNVPQGGLCILERCF